MQHTKELLSIKLSDLVPSPRNVRRHSTGDVQALAALIASQGLLHPLIVFERASSAVKARKLRFEVAAGERRRRAMLLLQREGRLPKSHEVLCELVARERALEISIAENCGREPLHPADEFDAFKAMIDEGRGDRGRGGAVRRVTADSAAPANARGVVAEADGADAHRRPRGAGGELVRGAAMGAECRGDLRRLTSGEIDAVRIGLARFVGIQAYEAAGGVVKRDPFDSEQSRFLCDPALLQRVATEKLETTAEDICAEGWGWVEVRLDVDSHALRRFSPSDYDLRKPRPASARNSPNWPGAAANSIGRAMLWASVTKAGPTKPRRSNWRSRTSPRGSGRSSTGCGCGRRPSRGGSRRRSGLRLDDTVTVWCAAPDGANHRVATTSNAIMWLVLTRASLPDAPYWPGRRALALADAVAWPAGWIALAMEAPQPTGIVGPLIIAVGVLSAAGRMHRAARQNHRYHFTTWRWGRPVVGMLLIGLTLQLTLRV